MAYREVTMVEIKEVLRLWLAGGKNKQIAKQLGLDPKTVRRYIGTAQACHTAASDSSCCRAGRRFTSAPATSSRHIQAHR